MRTPRQSLAPLVILAAVAVFVVPGCAQPSAPPLAIAHVHGLAYDDETGNLFLATHHGLARGQPAANGWTWRFIGDPYDYMGFTQDVHRSGTFYSSGHPDDPRAYGGVHLGLRRSTDGGETWEQRSLKGEVDFHALTALHGSEGRLAGFWKGAIKVSGDAGLTWNDTAGPPASVLALASAEGQLFAATTNGLYRSLEVDGFATWSRIAGPTGGLASSVAAAPDGQLLLVGTGDGRAGSAYRSLDGGATWQALSHALLADAPGQVQFVIDGSEPDHAFAALGGGGLLESFDAGENWKRIR